MTREGRGVVADHLRSEGLSNKKVYGGLPYTSGDPESPADAGQGAAFFLGVSIFEATPFSWVTL
jgi:hypothetical protein